MAASLPVGRWYRGWPFGFVLLVVSVGAGALVLERTGQALRRPRAAPASLRQSPPKAPAAPAALPVGAAVPLAAEEPAAALLPTGRGQVALTFDVGSNRGKIAQTIAVLKENGVPATFFMTGRWMEKNPDLTRQISDAGFTIANHSYSHPHMPRLSKQAMGEELDKTARIALSITGRPMAPYFRPPFGDVSDALMRVAGAHGYTVVLWSVDGWDWMPKTTAGLTEHRVLSRVRPHSIVLMHGATPPAAAALPEIIAVLKQRDYHLVTLDALRHGRRVAVME